MRIAYVSADFGVPIFGYKGASRHVREVVAAFAAAGHRVWVLSPAMHEGGPSEQQSNFGEDARRLAGAAKEQAATFARTFTPAALANVEFVTVPPAERHLAAVAELLGIDSFLGRPTSIRQELRSILYNLAVAEQALDQLRAERVDFVYERYAALSWAGIEVARALGVPHLLEVNAPLAFEHDKRRGLELPRLAHDAERRIFFETDHVVAVSNELRELIVAGGVPGARVSVLPNAVDPARFSPGRATARDALRRKYGLDGKRVVGFVGSLKPWHGTHTLVDAFVGAHAGAPEAALLIVGDGPERQALEQRVEARGLRGAVRFTGNVPSDDVPDHVAAMDIAVAPYVPSENFYYSPLKIFEYMAMAKPVVAGAIGQVRELLRDGHTGVLFEPGNVDALTHALARLVRDPGLCERIGAEARAYIVGEHSWERNAERLVALAAGLIAEGRRAAAPAGS
jgi:glycosyltransferase involved in cell wall biosynthesis